VFAVSEVLEGEGGEAEIAFIHLPPVLVLGSPHSSVHFFIRNKKIVIFFFF
jgi:hypothetical protein